MLTSLLTSCARFESQPLSSARNATAFEQRSLAAPGLKVFLETNGLVSAWPRESWDLQALTLAAFYYHPDMDLARARWHTARAGKITAGQRPNPNLAFTPRLNSTALNAAVTPWILGSLFDFPIETAGKRKYRLAQAEHLSQAAWLEIANTAWLVRHRVRQSLLDLQGAQETAALLRQHAQALERVSQLVERQWEAGAVSPVELSGARIGYHNAQLTLKDAQRQQAEARGRLAEALGVPLGALSVMTVSFADLGAFPTNFNSGDLHRQAALNRPDVLRALAEYAASQAALQLQIAKQYPDLHLRPGYELDQNENKWTLGLSLDLPLLNQNQGPIAEAKARREEAAAKFNSVQTTALGEIDRATEVYLAAAAQAGTAEAILSNLQKRRAAMARMHEAGEVDKLVLTTAEAEYLTGALAQLKARLQAHAALAALEFAAQSPLPVTIENLATSARISEQHTIP